MAFGTPENARHRLKRLPQVVVNIEKREHEGVTGDIDYTDTSGDMYIFNGTQSKIQNQNPGF